MDWLGKAFRTVFFASVAFSGASANAQVYGLDFRRDQTGSQAGYLHVIKFDPSTGGETSLGKLKYYDGGPTDFQPISGSGSGIKKSGYYDAELNKIFIFGYQNGSWDGNNSNYQYVTFDLSDNTFSDAKDLSDSTLSSTSLQGTSLTPSIIPSYSSLVTMQSDGIHIGANSLILNESGGAQSMWASNGSSAIDIDINNGSDLLVNGSSVSAGIAANTTNIATNTTNIATNTSNIQSNRQLINENTDEITNINDAIDELTPNVEGDDLGALSTISNEFDALTPKVQGDGIRAAVTAIKRNKNDIVNLGDGISSVGALSAALTGLPTSTGDAPVACGIGGGEYSSRYAMSIGCAAELSERVTLNAGGSFVFGDSISYAGRSLDQGAAKLGLIFKLGKIDSPAANSQQLQTKLDQVLQENAAIKAKYSAIEQQNKALMARLERLEAIALGVKPAATLASLK